VFAVLARSWLGPLRSPYRSWAAGCPGSSKPRSFGPKGSASVVYGLIVLDSDAAGRDVMFHLIALVVVLSILAQRVSRRRT
jgi:hypothetical protein